MKSSSLQRSSSLRFSSRIAPLLFAQETSQASALDKKVRAFLDSHRGEWHDMNVPEIDGKLLYDIIIRNKYTKALEIGTSTGHSAIWIAWALSKTGGKLITVEIDESRYKNGIGKFQESRTFGIYRCATRRCTRACAEIERTIRLCLLRCG